MSSSPLITVIALCYNHSKYVVECLEGIRRQTYSTLQLIIMDDCSKDNSVTVIQDWIQHHQMECTFIPHEKNQGVCKTINEALTISKGDYIAIVSTDDVWLEHKLADQIKIFQESSPETGVVYSNAYQIDAEGNSLKKNFLESYEKLHNAPEGWLFSILAIHNFIPAPTALIKRECFEKVGTYDETLCYEDYDMWLRISKHYTFAFCSIIGTQYRVLASSLTAKMDGEFSLLRYQSDFTINKKLLDEGKLNPTDFKILQAKLSNCTYHLARLGSQNIVDQLHYTVKMHPKFVTWILLILNKIKIPIKIQKFVIESIRSLKRFSRHLISSHK